MTSRYWAGDCGRRWSYGSTSGLNPDDFVPYVRTVLPTDSRSAYTDFRFARSRQPTVVE